MEKAFLISKIHFDVEEVNYPQLKEYTNNVILEHVNESGSDLFYFKRSLLELNRLNYNIGILLNTDDILSTDQLIKNLVWNMKGFKINLGIWVKGSLKETVADILRKEFKNNFIVGIVTDEDTDNIPRWGINGDIEEINNISLDYKTIYEENNLRPIVSTY